MNKKEIERLLKESGGISLDIGCGEHKQPTFVGMDIRAVDGVDIVHDFEEFPWPLPDESCIRAMASHVIEHINPAKFGMINFMNEVWRVLKYDCQFWISVPYAGSKGYWQDPTHINGCVEATWAYFDPLASSAYDQPGKFGTLYGIYKPKPWRIDTLNWDVPGNMEVVLEKRREDRSYVE